MLKLFSKEDFAIAVIENEELTIAVIGFSTIAAIAGILVGMVWYQEHHPDVAEPARPASHCASLKMSFANSASRPA